ncbi:site-specific DNA-methyltransferase [Micromonospora sp. DT46]|uniref:site-specific DNA-methyltransferase n=1 Tax=Micromonospora sp. DT46 TaxID=3393435 RepID=UPI003CF9575B
MGKELALIPSEHGKYDYAWVSPTDPRAREVKSIDVTEQLGEMEGPTGAQENMVIAGDSGDALRSLSAIPELRERYAGKVKLVYIDPPFNTEQTFEHYADQLEHSIWLTMMRDRIRDIKPLLADDASIWVHLDDAEMHRMRVLLDEEFGPDSFVAAIVWQKRTSRDNRAAFSPSQDYILVYAPSGPQKWKQTRNLLPDLGRFSNPDNDPRGPWRSVPMSVQAGRATASQFWNVRTPTGVVHPPPPNRAWTYTESRFQEFRKQGLIYWPRNGNGKPRLKKFSSKDDGLVPFTLWLSSDVDDNAGAKRESTALFGEECVFDTPKPERLLERIIHIATAPGDLVLDCFAGSGTTAAAAHKMGRRWLVVELQDRNVETFIKPRLTRVVEGTDSVGISVTTERVPVDELPDGMTPEEAQKFTTLLGRVAKSVEGLDEQTLRALRVATRTRDETTVRWKGGGGFTIARVGPSMYEVDDEDGEVYLSEAATNGAWSKAVAGQLRFKLAPDHPVFCGSRQRQRLAVIDGVVDETVVRTVVEHLGDKERAVIVAKAVLPQAQELLSRLSPGSRIKKAPDDLFPKATVK